MPKGVEEKPGRGEHRQLDPKAAFWLALLLILKGNGLRAPLAAQIAEDLRIKVRSIANNLGWDPGFDPFVGKFDTEHKWCADVADLRFVRVVTSANPSRRGQLMELPWHELGGREMPNVQPVIFVRIDLAGLARKLM
jgi:hypothetical protein